jgi:formamidopyrimidine-DNA glycosylase
MTAFPRCHGSQTYIHIVLRQTVLCRRQVGEQFLKNVPRDTETLNKEVNQREKFLLLKKKKKNKTMAVHLSMEMTLVLLLAKIFH